MTDYQFSLRRLFLLIGLIALTLGTAKGCNMAMRGSAVNEPMLVVILFGVTVTSFCAAIGALFRYIWFGVAIGIVVSILFSPFIWAMVVGIGC